MLRIVLAIVLFGVAFSAAPAAAADDAGTEGPAVVAGPPTVVCDNEESARSFARGRVAGALGYFVKLLDIERARGRDAAALDTLGSAEVKLREIANTTDLILNEMSECDKSQVADRAISAMETVASLAADATTATPAPVAAAPRPVAVKPQQPAQAQQQPKFTPKPQWTPAPTTPKPAPQWTPKPPRCDDKLYANKYRMVAAFERYHSINDKMFYAVKRTASEATISVLLANDRTMHATYDRAKQEILGSGCNGDFGAAAADRAIATFERAYMSSASFLIQVQGQTH